MLLEYILNQIKDANIINNIILQRNVMLISTI